MIHKLCLCLLVLLISHGCAHHDKVIDHPGVTVNLDEQSGSLGIVRKVLDDETDSARTEADRIRLLADEGKRLAPQLPQWDAIKKSADKMSDSLVKLANATKALAEIEVQLKLAAGELTRMRSAMDANVTKVMELESIIEKQKKELADFESGIKARQQKIWLGVTTFSALILVIGVFIFIYGSMKKLGMALIISAITLTSVSYFMAQYVFIVAMIGGGILFFVIAALIYHVVVNRKALFETVKTVEIMKPEGWSEGQREVLKEEVRAIQSPSTAKIVDQIRCVHGKDNSTCMECKKSQ